jgi:integrase
MCFAPYTALISTPITLLRNYKKILTRAGLPDIRFHDLRHSAATLLLSLGIHPKVVQELLGHTQISMTMDVYSHVLPGMQQDAMRQLDAALIKQERHEKEAE